MGIGPVGPVANADHKARALSAWAASHDPLPDPPDRRAYLVLKVSKCRGGARFTVATACFDGSDGNGVDALADITGGDASSDEGLSTGATQEPGRKGRRGVSRARGASRSGRRRHDGRGDDRGRDAPHDDNDDDTGPDDDGA
ncbi:hypothetical protein [Rhizobacter sp. SG703]|uniref:hypothetical protein n=1 Tax=Rhizobacter sp. SG703 TaxID=2587140 RepID=UPI001444B6B1|nr:hypothetical protein [Rhizobacter sp. SG703]NKI95155.1 hypothetical protein [Rhizobacter sp. SG703]